MTSRVGAAVGVLACLATGCVTERVSRGAGAARWQHQARADQDARTVAAWPWQKPAEEAQPVRWEWATAVPSSVPRAEVCRPTIPATSLAAVVPGFRDHAVVQASAGGEPPALVVTGLNGHAVKHCNQLHDAVERVSATGQPVRVAVLPANAPPNTSPTVVTVEPPALLPLVHAAAPEQPLMRVTEDGNPWVVLRQDGIRCKVMARVEPTRGVLHVVMSLGLCWGPPALLPAEVRATCDGQSLDCLTAADTLEVLYGGAARVRSAAGGTASFAAVSDRDDYLMPTNFRRLAEDQAAAGPAAATLPALATVGGQPYPGPAILGDARALSAFLMQKQLYQAGEPERVSWLVFAGDAMRSAEKVELTVDLGRGPTVLTFALPRR